MHALPLVSIVIPVYNCEAYVAEAVNSALAQDYPAKEIIVIDDGSKDRSVEILRGFGDSIRLLQVPNGGPARARNTGLAVAGGEYVAFLDADDVWLPGKLSAQVACMQAQPDLGICFTKWHVWPADKDGRFVRPAWSSQDFGRPGPVAERNGWLYSRLLFECELLTTTVMMRVSVARAVGGFPVDLPVGEDYDFWLRMSRAARITQLDAVGALYRVLPNSASRVPRSTNHELEVVMQAVRRDGLVDVDGRVVPAEAIDRRVSALRFQHAYLHLHQGSGLVAMRGFLALARQQPWRLKLWIHAARSLLRAARGAA